MSTTYESFHAFETANGYAYYNDRNITEEFDETKDYIAGDLVFHTPYAVDDYLTLYQFKVDHPAGVWNENHVKNIQLDQLLKTNKSGLNLKDRKIIVIGDSWANLERSGNWLAPFANKMGTMTQAQAKNFSSPTYYTDTFLHIENGWNSFINGKTELEIKSAVQKIQIFALTHGLFGFIGQELAQVHRSKTISPLNWKDYCNIYWSLLEEGNYIDNDTITDIFILGGLNDRGYVQSEIFSYIDEFKTWLDRFKNANIYLGTVGNVTLLNWRAPLSLVRNNYIAKTKEFSPKWHYLYGIEGYCHRQDFLNYLGNPNADLILDGRDGGHPVGDCGENIASYMVNTLKGIEKNPAVIMGYVDSYKNSDFVASPSHYYSSIDNTTINSVLNFRTIPTFMASKGHEIISENEDLIIGKMVGSTYFLESSEKYQGQALCQIEYKANISSNKTKIMATVPIYITNDKNEETGEYIDTNLLAIKLPNDLTIGNIVTQIKILFINLNQFIYEGIDTTYMPLKPPTESEIKDNHIHIYWKPVDKATRYIINRVFQDEEKDNNIVYTTYLGDPNDFDSTDNQFHFIDKNVSKDTYCRYVVRGYNDWEQVSGYYASVWENIKQTSESINQSEKLIKNVAFTSTSGKVNVRWLYNDKNTFEKLDHIELRYLTSDNVNGFVDNISIPSSYPGDQIQCVEYNFMDTTEKVLYYLQPYQKGINTEKYKGLPYQSVLIKNNKPATPTNFTAKLLTNNRINLQWSYVQKPSGYNIIKIYKREKTKNGDVESWGNWSDNNPSTVDEISDNKGSIVFDYAFGENVVSCQFKIIRFYNNVDSDPSYSNIVNSTDSIGDDLLVWNQNNPRHLENVQYIWWYGTNLNKTVGPFEKDLSELTAIPITTKEKTIDPSSSNHDSTKKVEIRFRTPLVDITKYTTLSIIMTAAKKPFNLIFCYPAGYRTVGGDDDYVNIGDYEVGTTSININLNDVISHISTIYLNEPSRFGLQFTLKTADNVDITNITEIKFIKSS